MTSRHLNSLLLAALLAAWPLRAASEEAAPNPPSEQEYWMQAENGQWEKALIEAERLVEARRLQANEAPLELAEALGLLGRANLVLGNHRDAEAAYSESLQILQPRVAITSEKLLPPLRGLGHTLAAAGKYEQAVTHLEHALRLSRRTHGLFDLNQQDILRQLATVLTRLGRRVEAEQQMQYLVRVGEQTFGAKDPRMAQVYDVVGDFYVGLGLFNAGRDYYRRALTVVERKLGRNDLATVMPLRSYAESYRIELLFSTLTTPRNERAPPDYDLRSLSPRYLHSDGERALQRALKTLESNPGRSTAMHFDTLLDLGDWYMIKEDAGRAASYYRRAASLLDAVEPEKAAASRAKLSFPAQLHFQIPPAARHQNRDTSEGEQQFVQVTFTVAADGSIRDERVVDENASSRQVSDTLSAVKAARYRPRFVNGEPVDTYDVSVRQVFR